MLTNSDGAEKVVKNEDGKVEAETMYNFPVSAQLSDSDVNRDETEFPMRSPDVVHSFENDSTISHAGLGRSPPVSSKGLGMHVEFYENGKVKSQTMGAYGVWANCVTNFCDTCCKPVVFFCLSACCPCGDKQLLHGNSNANVQIPQPQAMPSQRPPQQIQQQASPESSTQQDLESPPQTTQTNLKQ